MKTREALALYDQGTEQTKPKEPTMNMTPAICKDDAPAIWTAVVGLESGETVKQPGSLTYAAANEAADIEADKLAAQGKAVEWSGARRTAPSHGAMRGSFQGSPTPPHGHHLEKPSTDSKWNAPATQQAAHESLTGIWLAIGGTSERLWHVGATGPAIGAGPAMQCTKVQKQQRAKAALLSAVQRHERRKQNLTKPHKATAVRKGDDGLTRERDEHAHDTSAWAD